MPDPAIPPAPEGERANEDRRFRCAVCGGATIAASATFRDRGLQWTVPTRFCRTASCLLKRGAVSVPIKTLQS